MATWQLASRSHFKVTKWQEGLCWVSREVCCLKMCKLTKLQWMIKIWPMVQNCPLFRYHQPNGQLAASDTRYGRPPSTDIYTSCNQSPSVAAQLSPNFIMASSPPDWRLITSSTFMTMPRIFKKAELILKIVPPRHAVAGGFVTVALGDNKELFYSLVCYF